MYETSFKLNDHSGKENASSVRMKTFIDHDPAIVESKINEWLTSNDVEIRHIGQSQSERSGRFVFAISVFYTR